MLYNGVDDSLPEAVLQLAEGREEAGAVCLDVAALLADAKLDGEPVALKQSGILGLSSTRCKISDVAVVFFFVPSKCPSKHSKCNVRIGEIKDCMQHPRCAFPYCIFSTYYALSCHVKCDVPPPTLWQG